MSISNAPARAIADVGTGTILASVEIAASPERVFRALTTDDITKWWGSPELYRTTEYTGDVRPGGHWRSAGVGADGKTFSVEGEFRVVEPPHTLVQTWRAAWDGGNETTITYRLESIPGGTRLTLRHDGFADRVDSCRGHGEGWGRVLEWLRAHLTSPPATADKFFLCRLLAPRPTFAHDMDAAEREVMLAHASYWRGLLAKKQVIVFGPVGDPNGPWGLGVVRAPDEQTVTTLRENDPAILSNRGFRYEVLPMLNAVF